MYQNQYTDLYGRFPSVLQRNEVVKVNGANGANALNMPPNSSMLALDLNDPIVWLCQSDGAGYKTVTPYEIKPYQPKAPIDVELLEQRIMKLEEQVNAKSNDRTTTKFEQHAKSNEQL